MANSKAVNVKRNLLVRNAVKVVLTLQAAMDDADTPEHVKPRLLACLELLDRGLLGQSMADERVVIELRGGAAYLISQSDYVQVKIRDLNNEFEG